MSSRGIVRFGSWSPEIVRQFSAAHPGPLVSVGSGAGKLETRVESCLCVDPDPPADAEVAPVAASTTELVTNRPDLVGEAALMCVWCLPNDSSYDMEAVELLRPTAVLTLVEVYCGENGAAGGKRFHRWLKNPEGYRTVHTVGIRGENETDSVFKWVWLERLDQSCPPPELPGEVEGVGRGIDSGECVIS